jgi:hypothetical protein
MIAVMFPLSLFLYTHTHTHTHTHTCIEDHVCIYVCICLIDLVSTYEGKHVAFVLQITLQTSRCIKVTYYSQSFSRVMSV